MKNLFTLAIFYFMGFTGNAQNIKPTLSVTAFEKAISNSNIQVLDVRTATEYNSGHLKNSLQADWYDQQQFKDRTQHFDKTKPVYVYCQTGIRSAAAVALLKKNGFSNVHDLNGGLNAWKQADKPVEDIAKVEQITKDEYNKEINSSGVVLVDFGAAWCPPCKQMEPVIEQLENEAVGKYKIVKIDAATQVAILKQMNIDVLPVFIIYKNGKLVWRKQGVSTLEELKSKL
jgi:rhodanese-related sulfurtransferase